MNKNILKTVIADNQIEVPKYKVIPRGFIFEKFGNYVFVGIRRAGKSFLLYQQYPITYIIWILIVTLSCQPNKERKASEVDNISFNDVNTLSLDSSSITCSFVALETTMDALIGRITKVEVYEDKLFIMDALNSKRLYVYDMNGQLIAKVGSLGNGPGEYISPHTFYIDRENQTITIDDRDLHKLLVYDLRTYNYVRSLHIPFGFVSYIPLDNANYAWFDALGFKKARELYYIQITDSLFEYNNYYLDAVFTSGHGVMLGDNFYNYNNHAYFYNSFLPDIYELSTEGVRLKHTVSFGSHYLPSIDYLNQKGKSNQTEELLSSEYIASYGIMETKSFVLSSYLLKGTFFIGLYHKKTGHSWKYNYTDFITTTQIGGINMPFVGCDNERFITFIPSSLLKRNPPNRAELLALSEKLSEEDNPILCFIQFKNITNQP